MKQPSLPIDRLSDGRTAMLSGCHSRRSQDNLDSVTGSRSGNSTFFPPPPSNTLAKRRPQREWVGWGHGRTDGRTTGRPTCYHARALAAAVAVGVHRRYAAYFATATAAAAGHFLSSPTSDV